MALNLYAKAVRRPADLVALLAAAATSLTIVVNAVFLQSGTHPAPFFANPKPTAIGGSPTPAVPAGLGQWLGTMPSPQTVGAPQPTAVRRNDPIAELIGPSPRIAAVQRVLSDYGYGQLSPSGLLDEPTIGAIEKFERERRLPITGRVSDRLIGALGTMVGHPVEQVQ